MMTLYELMWLPFEEFTFMRRALVGTAALALGCGPVGLFLVMRRMSLMGDAMSHAVLPGVAAAYLLAGLSLPAMSVGGLIAGMAVVLLSSWVSRFSALREDASLAAFYLLALAVGVLMVTRFGSQIDLMHILFGSVLALDQAGLVMVAGISSVTLLVLAVLYRPLLLENVDPVFLRTAGRGTWWCQPIFMMLVVLNLVAGFQALGTLMAVGLMMIPAITARLWCRSVGLILLGAIGIALISGYMGLLLSFYWDLPSGPAIILSAGSFYLSSLLIAPVGGVLPRYWRLRHLAN